MSSRSVSVVIPLYNHEKYIETAVNSVLAQNDSLLELIVIDDGSRDNSAQIMDVLAEKNSDRIKFIRQTNHGAHATINRGLEMAQGEYVTILNSDDYFEPGRFKACIRALELDLDSDIVASSIGFVNDHGESIENPWFVDALNTFKKNRDVGKSLIDANYIMTTSNIFMRRSLLMRIGYFAPLRYAHDLEFLLRCAAVGVRFCFLDRRLMNYRFHSSNTISENHSKVRAEWAMCAATYILCAENVKFEWSGEYYHACMEIVQKHGLRSATEIAINHFKSLGEKCVTDVIMADSDFFAKMMKAV